MPAPKPANTPGRQQVGTVVTPPRKAATAPKPKPRSRAPQAAQAAVRPKPKPASRAPQAAQAATGPYADAFNQLSTESAQTSDVERRQLQDNQAYQEWLRAGQQQRSAALLASDTAQQERSTRIQAATTAAQQQTQQTLDAQRGTRVGTATDGPGSTRARLAGDDTLTQALLASEQQRSAITAQGSAQKQAFLGAATEAAGAASAATIRGQAGERLQDIGRRRGELSVHRDDTLSAERAAKAQAAADAVKAQIDAVRSDRAIDARLAIAQATLGQRASDNAASRALRAQQGRADRRTRKELARAKGSTKKGSVSPAEQRARSESARTLDADIEKATAVAKALRRGGGKLKDGTKAPPITDPDTLRAGILALYPNISADALDAAVTAVTSPGGVMGAAARTLGDDKRKKARRKRLTGN